MKIRNQFWLRTWVYTLYTLGIYCLSIWIKPTESYHRYPFMPPTPTEIYYVQILETQFELYHVYPKLALMG